ncbi:MAG: ATP-binding cassette domain-containing protein [Alphaproteobacteria bacterium]|nr:ATP-binding cassette domain-containing protein [Alphaproteobacteria bacterium]
MTDLLKRLLRRPGVFISLVVASLFINALALAGPLFVIQVINRYVSQGVDATLATLTIGALFATVMEFGFRQVRLSLANAVAVRLDETLSMDNFKLMLTARIGPFEQVTPGLKRQFMRGSETIQQAFSAPNIATILDLPFALLFLFMMLLLSPALAAIATVFSGVVLLLATLNTNKVDTTNRDLIRESSAGNRHLDSALEAGDTVRSFGAGRYLFRAWQDHIREAHSLTRRIFGQRGLTQSLTQSAMAAMSITIVAVGGVLVVGGKLDVGVMIGCNILGARTLAAVSRFSMLGETFSRAKQCIKLFQEIYRLPREQGEGAQLDGYRGGLALRDVRFAFHGQPTPLFETLNLDLQPGAVLLVSGKNGAGKTTFCRLLAGLIEPERGDILADGVDVRQLNSDWWRRQIRYLPQEPKFLNATIAENLRTLNPGIDDNGLNAAIEAAGLKPFISQSPEGFNTLITDNGRHLSLGIRRRLALARAMTGTGLLAIFDEPTEGLDRDGARAVYATLNQMTKEGVTIVICSLDPYIQQAAQLILDLDKKPVPSVYVNPALKGKREGGFSGWLGGVEEDAGTEPNPQFSVEEETAP